MMLPKKRIQVVVMDENGVEHVVSTEDAPAQATAFGESERASIKAEVLAIAANVATELNLGEFRYPQIIDKDMRNPKAGQYLVKEHTVVINMLLHKDLTAYRDTLIHEVAHAVVEELKRMYVARGMKNFSGSRWANHGLYWRVVMEKMGAEAAPRHNMDVAGVMPEKYVSYQCPCGQRIQHGKRALANAVARGEKWSCKRCNRPIDMNAWSGLPAAVGTVTGGKRRHGLNADLRVLRTMMRR